MEKKDPNYTVADYIKELGEKGITPHVYLPNHLTKEDVEKIHLAHRLLYELLGMHARVLFKKKSGMEELLGEERVRELEEEVKRLKRGEHIKGIFEEDRNSKRREVTVQKMSAQKPSTPPRTAREEKKVETQAPTKKKPFAIDDIDTSKAEKQRVTGRIVATFEERAFAEEFASLKGADLLPAVRV